MAAAHPDDRKLVQCRIAAPLHKRLERKAKEQGLTLAAYVRQLIIHHVTPEKPVSVRFDKENP